MPVNASIPLVGTPDPDVISPNAVGLMVDAFRKGQIGVQDIHDRIVNRAIAEQQLTPDAIQARQAANKATVAQSGLAVQQANAAGGLVNPQTDLAAAQIARQKADLLGKQQIDTYLGYGGKPIMGPDGKPDFTAMSEKGGILMSAATQYDMANRRSIPASKRTTKLPNGSTVVEDLNSLGEAVTPGSALHQQLQRQRFQAMSAFSNAGITWFGDQQPGTVAPAVQPSTAPSFAPTIQGLPATGAEVSPKPVMQDALPGGPASQSGDVAPRTAPAQVVRPMGTSEEGTNFRQEEPGPLQTQPGIQEWLYKQPTYQQWSANVENINAFRAAAKGVTVPNADSQVMNENDLRLLSAVRAVVSTSTSGSSAGGVKSAPELRLSELEGRKSLKELLGGVWREKVMRTAVLSEGERQRLIQIGSDAIHAKEKTAMGALSQAAYYTGKAGLSFDDVFGPATPENHVRALLNGQSAAPDVEGSSPTSAEGATVKARPAVIVGGKQFTF